MFYSKSRLEHLYNSLQLQPQFSIFLITRSFHSKTQSSLTVHPKIQTLIFKHLPYIQYFSSPKDNVKIKLDSSF